MGVKLIIDTDPGVDDALAIALAALSPDVDLLGVTTVFGNVPVATTTRNARGLLQLCGRPDVPVAQGAERPLVRPNPEYSRNVHGEDGLSGQAGALPAPERAPDETDAVSLLLSLLEAADEPVTLAPIGPMTNIALLLAAHPGIRAKIGRIVAMGGALEFGNKTPSAEFNIWADPEAAHRVLVEESVPLVLVPLDLTHKCAVDAAWLDRLGESGAVGAALKSMTGDYLGYYRQALGFEGIVIHDAVAIAEAIKPGILATTSYPVEVDIGLGPARGTTLVDRRTPRRESSSRVVDIALDTDFDGLRSFMLDGITGGRR
ncbi:nucleoside hydrolase [Amycolatopsis minnesotensis]|uniref:Nucleoside hydrolase n=1 Tax=Amycolatopsis minnesotensis TaxID=337894 RepID=A0ABN2REX1_9PSEU